MIRVLFVPVSGRCEARTVERSLESFQSLVGGPFEVVSSERFDLYCHEEGKLLKLPENFRATVLLETARPGFTEHDVIVGPAFFAGPVDEEGHATSVPDDLVAAAVTADLATVEAFQTAFGDGSLEFGSSEEDDD